MNEKYLQEKQNIVQERKKNQGLLYDSNVNRLYIVIIRYTEYWTNQIILSLYRVVGEIERMYVYDGYRRRKEI